MKAVEWGSLIMGVTTTAWLIVTFMVEIASDMYQRLLSVLF